MHGKGTYTWKDGRKYDGQYLHDKKHGNGIYTWADGRRYDGQWAYGKQNGKGKYILPDGTVRVGVWEDGKRIQWLDETPNASIQNTQSAHNSGVIPNNVMSGANNTSLGLNNSVALDNARSLNFNGSGIKVNDATNQSNFVQGAFSNNNSNVANNSNLRY